jgi:ribokinase
MKRIFVVGSINTDLVISAPYFPKKGETLTGSDFFSAHGGKGANQAVAAARAEGRVYMCGCVGDDSFGENAIAALKADGIDTTFVRVQTGVPTGTAVIVVTDGDNRIIIDRGANDCLTFDDVDKALEQAEEGDIYLTQLENPIEVIGYGLRRAREKGMYVILNPAPADVRATELIKYCDLITPNETETEIFGGRDRLVSEGTTLLITLGGKGFEINDDKGRREYPCIKITPVDTTAAGDTLCGALAAGLARGESLDDAAVFASLTASIACTRRGAQPSIPTRAEVKEFKLGLK